jgi:fermentation-respiration switch protein FrsA (DUF1100 family)
VSLLVTQHFEAARKVDKIDSPLLLVHGDEDQLILPGLGRKLFNAAVQLKLFMRVKSGSNHNTYVVEQPQYRLALAQLFDF